MVSPALMKLPTGLTLARIIFSPLLTLCIVRGWAWAAIAILVFAAVTDFLDGWTARRWGATSDLGAALDPIADKILTGCALVGFIAVGTIYGPLLIPALAILLRELFVSGLREHAAGTIKLPVTPIAKVKTSLQFVSLVALCFGASMWSGALLWAAAILTVWTGSQYTMAWLSKVSKSS